MKILEGSLNLIRANKVPNPRIKWKLAYLMRKGREHQMMMRIFWPKPFKARNSKRLHRMWLCNNSRNKARCCWSLTRNSSPHHRVHLRHPPPLNLCLHLHPQARQWVSITLSNPAHKILSPKNNNLIWFLPPHQWTLSIPTLSQVDPS